MKRVVEVLLRLLLEHSDFAFSGKLDFRTYLYKVNALSVPKEGQYESTDTSTILSLKDKLDTIG